jgi:hypothetical protein
MQSRTGAPTCGTQLGIAWVDAGTCALTRMLPPAPLGEVLETASVEASNYAAYQFFASFFTHPLPKAFLWHYIYGKGKPRNLNAQEMADCNPHVTLLRSTIFSRYLDAIAKKPGRYTDLNFNVLSGALTNGTLGQFTAKVRGTLEYRALDDWEFRGDMSFFDEWDFDPKDFDTGGRSLQGELKTRFAHYTLPGQGFTITSDWAAFTQGSADETVTWAGGKPKPVLDRVAQSDVVLRGVDKAADK